MMHGKSGDTVNRDTVNREMTVFGKIDLEILVYQEGPPTGGTFGGILEFPYPSRPVWCPCPYMVADRHHF